MAAAIATDQHTSLGLPAGTGVAGRTSSLASDYRTVMVAGAISAAIVAGMALDLAPLTIGAAFAAFLAGIVSPPTGLAILAFMAPLRPPLVIPAPGLNALLVGATVLGCVYRLPLDRPTIRVPAPLLLLLGFVAYVSLQQLPELLSGYSGDVGHLVGYNFGQLLTSVGLIIAAAYVLRGRSPGPFVAIALVSAFIAAILALATFGHPAVGPLSNLVGTSNAVARAVGPFGDPNYFAVYQASAIATALAWMAVVRSRRARLLLFGTSMVLASTFAVSLSRGGLLALVAGLVALAFTRSRRTGAIALLVAVALIAVAYPVYVQWRVTADTSGASAQAYAGLAQSDQARLGAALAAPQLFATSPLFGIGFSHFSFMSGWYVGFPIESHDWYLNVLAEEGMVGVALWIPMLAAVAVALHRVSRSARTVGYAVLVTYAVGCAALQPPDSFQTSALTALVIVATLVGNWTEVPTAYRSHQTSGRARDERRSRA